MNPEQQYQLSVSAAALLLCLVILALIVVGVLWIWWASRFARQARRRRELKPTVMPDIWFLRNDEQAERDEV